MTLKNLINLLNIFIVSPTAQNMDNITDFVDNPENQFLMSEIASKDISNVMESIKTHRGQKTTPQEDSDVMPAFINNTESTDLTKFVPEVAALKKQLIILDSPDYISN